MPAIKNDCANMNDKTENNSDLDDDRSGFANNTIIQAVSITDDDFIVEGVENDKDKLGTDLTEEVEDDNQCFNDDLPENEGHPLTENGLQNFQCKLCPREFFWRENLTSHMLAHSSCKTFSCSMCRKEFVHRSGLPEHMLSDAGLEDFKCEDCLSTFTVSTSCLLAIARLKKFKCEVCLKYLSNKQSLKVHMSKHSGVKTFQCSICSKAFAIRYGLTKHMLSHTEIRKFQCELCEKRYKHQSYLTQHMLWAHSCLKIFECPTCAKSFTRRDELSVHKLTHSWLKATDVSTVWRDKI